MDDGDASHLDKKFGFPMDNVHSVIFFSFNGFPYLDLVVTELSLATALCVLSGSLLIKNQGYTNFIIPIYHFYVFICLC